MKLALLLLLGLQADAPFKSFDETITSFMKERDVPGGAVAVVKDGRLVYARGYGWADVEKKTPVSPRSLFRIASISKPVTAVAVLKLVQDGKIGLDDKAFPLLGVKPILEDGASPDPRLERITVRQLLHHTGGWDRSKSGDPMFRSIEISRAAGIDPPAPTDAIIRFMAGRPLDSDPGSKYAYSNFGYCVLGRIIEKVTGQEYGAYVRGEVLEPMGITAMKLGRSLRKDRCENEVVYYQPSSSAPRSVFPDTAGDASWPYGAFCMEALDAHGGWIASAVDLVRFASSLDKVLDAERREVMFARPPGLERKAWYYGLGWLVRPAGNEGKANTWHGGSLPGTSTLLVRRHDGLTWAVLFNRRSRRDGAIDPALHRAAKAVPEWPETDLFPRFR